MPKQMTYKEAVTTIDQIKAKFQDLTNMDLDELEQDITKAAEAFKVVEGRLKSIQDLVDNKL